MLVVGVHRSRVSCHAQHHLSQLSSSERLSAALIHLSQGLRPFQSLPGTIYSLTWDPQDPGTLGAKEGVSKAGCREGTEAPMVSSLGCWGLQVWCWQRAVLEECG